MQILAWPDAGGEGLERTKAEFLIELNGTVIDGRDGQRQFVEFQSAKRIHGSDHQRASQSMTLMTREHAELCCVPHAGRDLAR